MLLRYENHSGKTRHGDLMCFVVVVYKRELIETSPATPYVCLMVRTVFWIVMNGNFTDNLANVDRSTPSFVSCTVPPIVVEDFL